MTDMLLLCQVHLSFETPDHDQQVLTLADQAFRLAGHDRQRAMALAYKGKALTRLGNTAMASDVLRTALSYDPDNFDACKRLAALELAASRPESVVALTDLLFEQGVRNPRMFAARTVAQATMGDVDGARRTNGLATLQQADLLLPPPGYADLDALNAAVAQELLTHPGLRYERYGSASALTWRVENPLRSDRPAIRALITAIIATLEARIARLEPDSHPWAAAAPTEAWLRCWSVITESDGFESWHVHQFGWLSGVYYVQVPESIVRGNSNAGCLAFGVPDDLIGAHHADAYGEQLVRPKPGLMVTFPSHAYHRTYPHGGGEKRICLAFDVRPLLSPIAVPD